LFQHLSAAGISVSGSLSPIPVSGGDISAAWRVRSAGADFFVKTAPASAAEMFSAEAEGLDALANSGAIRVPHVFAAGNTDSDAFLVCEWLDLEPGNDAVERCLGEQLAALHRVTAEQYGWHRDNTIGLTPQQNDRSDNWVDFFRQHRLAFQLKLAAENGFEGELQTAGAQLMKRLPVFFDNAMPKASLLHGDLWSGNWASCDSEPVLFDPAVYYGDRETDLAMTRLFGGFGPAFYAAYEASWPLPEGHTERQSLYQLYHVLNHLNLFGSAYLEKAISLMRTLL
jgi:fructosamine-3-kinase